MAEVGIHLYHIVVTVLIAPAHTVEVSGTKSQLTLALHDEKTIGEPLHQALHDVGRTVGRIVLDDEHIELFFEGEDLADDGLDILFFVVSRGDNQCIRHISCSFN